MISDKPEDGSAVADVDVRLAALRARTRREILALVWDRELAAGEIAAAFSLRAATISEHLGVLRQAGLVRMTRVGTSRRYRARHDALAGLHGALEGSGKWEPAADIPERALAETSTKPAVVASVLVPTTPEDTFTAFTDPAVYSRWLQVPVSIQDGAFAATLEWGTEVRGRYEHVVPPHLLVMSWDFDDDNVPVPGRPLTGYLRLKPAQDADGGHTVGTVVEVHQLTETPEQAAFMHAAWGMVLGRLVENVADAVRTPASTRSRPRRPKQAPARPARAD